MDATCETRGYGQANLVNLVTVAVAQDEDLDPHVQTKRVSHEEVGRDSLFSYTNSLAA
jgi:hypothetical protein